jgi:hypothetical protein
MRSHLLIGVALCLALSALPDSTAIAFDGQRKGFVLGFGAGPTLYNAWDYDDGGSTISALGIQTNLKVGYAFSEQWQLYYAGQQGWLFTDGYLLSLLMPSVGFSRYFSPETNSAYLTAGAGPMFFAVTSIEYGGFGAAVGGASGFLGLGYEFAKHWSVEGNVIGTLLVETDIALIGFAVTVNVLGY